MRIEIAADVLRQRRLFVGTPMYGGQASGHYVRSMCELTRWCALHGVELRTCFLMNDSLITRARARVADEFLRSGCTHLMFIDADIGFDANDVVTLLALADEASDYDVIAAAYPKKGIDWPRLIGHARAEPAASADAARHRGLDFAFNPIANGADAPADRPIEVREAGTGFMMIRRTAFALFDRHYPQYRFRPDVDQGDSAQPAEMMLYFEGGIEAQTGRYLSEDYAFCQRIRQAGGHVWLCPWMRLSHVGTHVYTGSLAEASAAAPRIAVREPGEPVAGASRRLP